MNHKGRNHEPWPCIVRYRQAAVVAPYQSLNRLAEERTTCFLDSTSWTKKFAVLAGNFHHIWPVEGRICVWISSLPLLLRVRTLSEGSVPFSFWGFLKDAELRPLVAGGRRGDVFGCFDFGYRSYRGTIPCFQNKAKTKENEEAISLSFSTWYHRPHCEETYKRLQTMWAV